ncbi:hypothetical protein MTO96_034875 [Rhipicephalus appendiculatus]
MTGNGAVHRWCPQWTRAIRARVPAGVRERRVDAPTLTQVRDQLLESLQSSAGFPRDTHLATDCDKLAPHDSAPIEVRRRAGTCPRLATLKNDKERCFSTSTTSIVETTYMNSLALSE